MAKEGKSTRLESFEPEELANLAQLYPTIQRELRRHRDLSLVRLPDTAEPERRLEILRDLDAKGDLNIRISYAGNLNVLTRAAPGVGDEGGYFTIVRKP